MTSTDAVRYLGALMIAIVGAVHLQQYADFIKDVPTIGTLFVLNGAGAGAIVLMLAIPRLRALGAAMGIALCLGSLVAIALSFTSTGIFDYTETDLRTAVVIAIAAEAIAFAAFAALATLATFAHAARD